MKKHLHFKPLLAGLCLLACMALADGITMDWSYSPELGSILDKGGKKIEMKLPAIPVFYGYHPVVRLYLSSHDDALGLKVLVNGKALTSKDDRQLPRLRSKASAELDEQGNLQIDADASEDIVELCLADVMSEGKENSIALQNNADLNGILKKMQVLYRPEGLVACQMPPQDEKDAFTILPGTEFKILYQGNDFISDDGMIGLGRMAELDGEFHEEKDADGRLIASNVFVRHPIADFRREIAFDEEGALEFSMRCSYKEEYKGNYQWYRFAVPVSLLDGAKWDTWSGSAGGFDQKHGTFDLASLKDNERVFSHNEIRYLHVEKEGVRLNFDFNPYGSGDWYSKVPYAGNPIGIVTFVDKVGDKVYFNITKRPGADRYASKIRISAGDVDFAYRHYNTASVYYVGPFIDNPGLRLFFGGTEDNARRNENMPPNPNRGGLWACMQFQASADREYVPMLQEGWSLRPENGKTYSSRGLFPIASGYAVSGEGTGTYTIPAQPGVYSLQITVGHPETDLGPFDVSVNGEEVASGLTVAAGEYRQIFASVYLQSPEREANVSFRGANWSINQIIWRNSATEAEDFSIRRKFWRVAGLADFGSREDLWMVDSSDLPAVSVILGKEITPAYKVQGMKNGSVASKVKKVTPPLAQDDPALEWAWNAFITDISIDAGNAETGFCVYNDEFLYDRIREIRAKGYNTIIEQGLFWHTSYSDQNWNGLKEHQRRVNDILHKEGFKVIRHMDGPSFPLMAEGLAHCSRFPGAFGQHIESMQGYQGIGCITNPILRKWVMERIGDYIEATDSDGIMVDECVIADRDQCGCVHCRRKFQEDTGCVLPLPGDKSLDFSDASPLHAKWVEWKLEQNALFMYDLQKYVSTRRPGTLVTSYDIDLELCDGGGRVGYRADKFSQTDSFFGSEPCSINLYANYRNYYSLRKIMLSFSRSTGHPVWTLLYTWLSSSKANEGLTCWMMATLTGHGMWLGRGLSHPAMAWKGAMDRRNKESIADVAILYCPDARSFRGYSQFQPYMEGMGISQTLDDSHIIHDYINKMDLENRPEWLKRYKMIIVGNANVLSDAEVEVLRQWVSAGGTLLVTGSFAGVNEEYAVADTSRATALTGVVSKGVFEDLAAGTLEYAGKELPLPKRICPFTVQDAEPVASLADGRVWLASKKLGNGQVWTSALPLGEAQCETQFFRGQACNFNYDAKLAEWAPAVVRAIHGDAFPMSLVSNVPKEQKVEIFRDTKDGKVYCHCANMIGVNRAVFKEVPPADLADNAFSEGRDMAMELAGNYTGAIATSPDFQEEIAIECSNENGKTRFTLPASMLKHYTLITLIPAK